MDIYDDKDIAGEIRFQDNEKSSFQEICSLQFDKIEYGRVIGISDYGNITKIKINKKYIKRIEDQGSFKIISLLSQKENKK